MEVEVTAGAISASQGPLVEFGAFAAAERDLGKVFNQAVRVVAAGLGVGCCHIYRRPSDHRPLELVAGVGGEEDGARRSIELVALQAAEGRGPALGDRGSEGAVAAGGISVVIDGETAPFGVIAVFSGDSRVFTSADVEFMQFVAGIVSGVLRRAHDVRDRARFETVSASMDDAIVEITKDGRIFDWNASAEALFGYSRADAVGKSVTMLFPENVTSAAVTLLDLVCGSATLGPMELFLRRRDGTQIDAMVRLAPIVLPDGRIVAASMIARDMREKRRADRALQMHADILAHMPAAVMVWRLDDLDVPLSLRLVMVNRPAHRVAGGSLDGRIGARFADVPLEVSGINPEAIARVARRAEPQNFGECSMRPAGGVQRSYQVQAFPLPDQCVGVVFHDMTEQRELADQLQHAQRMEVIGRLSAGIAHDFNNLLTIIAGYAELLQHQVADSPSALNDLVEIDKASRSAQQLTRQLLALGRRQVLRPTAFDMLAFIRDARGMLTRVLGEDMRLIVVGEGPVIVTADVGQFEQVVLNLAINARDAMPAGGRLSFESSVVHVPALGPDSHREADPYTGVPPGTYGVLTICDNGLGMDKATLARVFEPFFTTKAAGKGTGLGLSTVYGIVKQSGGHITVKSEPGEGTTFRIYWPTGDQPIDEASAPKQVTVEPPTASRTVLLVDDDGALRLLLRKVLARAGYTVLEASDPEQALQLAGRFIGTIDLLLTDIVMPYQNGAELAARLMIRFPGLRVLYMSGYPRESMVGFRKLPRDASFIQKPLSLEHLRRAIQQALQSNDRDTERGSPERVM